MRFLYTFTNFVNKDITAISMRSIVVFIKLSLKVCSALITFLSHLMQGDHVLTAFNRKLWDTVYLATVISCNFTVHFCALDSGRALYVMIADERMWPRHSWRRDIDGIWRRKIKVRTHRRRTTDTRPEERHGRSAPWRDHNRSLRGRGAIK